MRICTGCGSRFESKYHTYYCDTCKKQGVRVYCGVCGVHMVVPYEKHRAKRSLASGFVFRCAVCTQHTSIVPELGNRHGKYLVVKLSHIDNNGLAHWVCKCDCGEVVVLIGSHLRKDSNIRPCRHTKKSIYLR